MWSNCRSVFVLALVNQLIAVVAVGVLCPAALAATAFWDGSLDNYWGETYAPLADSNWSGGSGLFGRPASGDSLVFSLSQQPGNTDLVDELATPGTYNIAGITFDATCPAYTTNPSDVFPPFPHGFTLTGDITNNSTNLQTINDVIVVNAVRTITMTAGGGNVALGGNISGAGGGFTTAGTGTLTMSATNSYTGALTVGATTTVNQTGAFNNGAGAAAGGNIVVGTAATNRAILNITNNVTAFDLWVGGATTGAGAVYQASGIVSFTDATAGAGAAAPDRIFSLGGAGSQGTAGYGYYRISNGSLSAKQFDVGARATGSVGVMEVTGGVASATSKISIGRGNNLTTATHGLLNVTGGTVNFATGTATDTLEMGYSAGGVNVLNVGRIGGGPGATVTGANTATGGVDLGNQNQTATGAVNLLPNGTLNTSRIFATNATPTTLVNFNGGTLRATTANAGSAFLTDANVDAVIVYSGGGTINNRDTTITIGRPLLAPAGSGVTSVPVATGGSGYIGAPMVRITGGGGTGATGYAVMSGSGNDQTVSSIVITSPGTGYTSAPAVTLSGGGATTAATLNAATTAANDSGGMTFTGLGTTVLTGANTYTGATTISSGTLLINGDNSLATGAVTVEAAGILGGGGTVGSQVWSDGTVSPGSSVGTLTVNGNVTMNDSSHFRVELSGATADNLVVNGDLDVSGLNNFLDVIGPGTGLSWQIASYTGMLTGTFENITAGYTVDYGTGANSVVTLNRVGVPGDYNDNGTVDAADYVLWRNGGPLQNEVDAPGTVNAADYSAWRARFGNTSGSGAGTSSVNATIPEPATPVLLAMGALAMSARRRTKVSSSRSCVTIVN